MGLVQGFDPPAFLDDFDGIPGQREAWHRFISERLDRAIAAQRRATKVQLYNPSAYEPGGPLVEQAVTWNAFPKELVRRFGRARAMIEADRRWPLSAYRGHYDPDRPQVTTPGVASDVFFRPQVEYCEWHVTRDPLTGELVRVTFTSEPPEYWTALFGGKLGEVTFPGAKDKLLALYRQLVDPRVQLEDLIVHTAFVGAQGEAYKPGDYHPFNRWNTTHGIAHLCAPSNTLASEIQLAGDATIRYHDGSGRPLTQPDALICGAGYGGINRNSDPTIGATVNALARLGAMVTLANPVGLYMDHIDTSGWELPDGIAARDCVRVVRGTPRMIERMVIEVPAETGRTLADLTIGGDPVRFGGQIAECITVKLVGLAAPLAKVSGNELVAPALRGTVSASSPTEIYELIDARRAPGPGLVAAMAATAPVEPALELDDIQGIAVPGFFKPHHTLLYLRATADVKLDAYCGALAGLPVTPGTATLHDRRLTRDGSARPRAQVLIAIGFTYDGLRRLVPSAAEITSTAFKHGLARRASLLGDPASVDDEGNPARWVVGGTTNPIDAMIVIAGDARDEVSAQAAQIRKDFAACGVEVEAQDGDARPDLPGHEHFGFNDGISQPGIRGRASASATDFITERHVDPSDTPAAWLYGYPGQDLVWPGEFVFGYPTTSPDPLLPGPIAHGGPAWTRNGSFLVYRRLRQDVAAFWTTMRDEAARLAALPGFTGMTDDRLAALLIGRWPSGAPVNRTPNKDLPALGTDPLANNYFLFDSDTPRLHLRNGSEDPFPAAKADPVGITCPWAAHIRKVNVRDSPSDMGGATATQNRRLLRVGVAFGPPLADKYGAAEDPLHGQRGLLFLSIQRSIEDQFEFLQARWMNDDARPKLPGGHDMLVGQNPAPRRCTLFGDGLSQAQVRAGKPFVIPTGGAYLFVPSLSTLRDVIGGLR
jgi:Dyp-type peroxidase family